MAERSTALLLLLPLLAGLPAGGRVLTTPEEALDRLFPPPAAIEKRTLVLDDERADAVEQEAASRLPSRILTCYVARSGPAGAERVRGYACIDTHVVRTLPETLLIALGPDLELLRIEILAFEEPPDYMPGKRFLQQFEGKTVEEDLVLRRDVRVLSGATLSSRAVTEAVRRIRAAVRRELLRKESER